MRQRYYGIILPSKLQISIWIRVYYIERTEVQTILGNRRWRGSPNWQINKAMATVLGSLSPVVIDIPPFLSIHFELTNSLGSQTQCLRVRWIALIRGVPRSSESGHLFCLLASLRAIATACFRLVTFCPDELCKEPLAYS